MGTRLSYGTGTHARGKATLARTWRAQERTQGQAMGCHAVGVTLGRRAARTETRRGAGDVDYAGT